MNFKVGDVVLCINSEGSNYLENNYLYVVKGLAYGDTHLVLEESEHYKGGESSYSVLRFKSIETSKLIKTFNIGDRFYFYNNMTDSDTVRIGFKGVIDDIIILHSPLGELGGKEIYCCDGYGFTEDEIKHLI